ncbi:hypothetical protein [Leisingera sp. M523]|uniref:hypothetical protein n=1 Tax=Leisingera sp. M523 TaxID=2867013 RepID=UPI0021A63B72|nr:hypothetical protein [Leisingera sp. M523]UWQ29910.1 hypothetical protein K3557_05010 [Leisingera sp. M523]
MPRILVKFRKGYSRYNKGETAAFGEEEARKLCAGKDPVADAVGEVEDGGAKVLAVQLDASAVRRATEEVRAELKSKARELGDREAVLQQREDEIATREKIVAAKEQAVEGAPADPADAGGSTDSGGKIAKASGEPPKQGASK